MRRWRRWGVIVLAVLLLHGMAVVWIARSRQIVWPQEPEQVIPALLLHPEPVRPAAPSHPKAPPKPVVRAPHPAAPKPAPQPAPAETSAAPPDVPDISDIAVGAAAGAAADTGLITDLGTERSAPPAEDRFALPPSTTLRYATYVNGVRNENGVIRWATDGKTYTLAVEIPLPLFFGSLAFHSVGAVDGDGLEPQQYEEVRGHRQPDVTTFHRPADPVPDSDAQGGPIITFTRTPAVVPLPDGVQDRFSVFLQLTGLARGNPERATSPGITLEIPIADTDSVELARVQRVGEDMIDTPAGTIRAQHFVRLPRREGDARRVEIWLAADNGWLPVRLRQTEPNGMQFELDYLSQE